MSDLNPESMHRLVWTALMASTIVVGAFVQLPLGPVPFSMQPFFVFLSGYILGPFGGALSVLLYVAAGTVGLPFFAGGKSGLAHLLGPTGGYLIGFIATAAFCGLAYRNRPEKPGWAIGVAWGLAGVCAVYAVGMTWLKFALDVSWLKAATIGVAPFVPGDLVKIVLAVGAYRYLHKYDLLPGRAQQPSA